MWYSFPDLHRAKHYRQNDKSSTNKICHNSALSNELFYIAVIIIIVNNFYLTHPFCMALRSSIFEINNIKAAQYTEEKF